VGSCDWQARATKRELTKALLSQSLNRLAIFLAFGIIEYYDTSRLQMIRGSIQASGPMNAVD
jgi:hypothetical protein